MDDRNTTEVLVARDVVIMLAGLYADPDTEALRRVRARLEGRAERARPRRTWLWGVAVPAAAAAAGPVRGNDDVRDAVGQHALRRRSRLP
jgi:hypothetical protein